MKVEERMLDEQTEISRWEVHILMWGEGCLGFVCGLDGVVFLVEMVDG